MCPCHSARNKKSSRSSNSLSGHLMACSHGRKSKATGCRRGRSCKSRKRNPSSKGSAKTSKNLEKIRAVQTEDQWPVDSSSGAVCPGRWTGRGARGAVYPRPFGDLLLFRFVRIGWSQICMVSLAVSSFFGFNADESCRPSLEVLSWGQTNVDLKSVWKLFDQFVQLSTSAMFFLIPMRLWNNNTQTETYPSST